MNYQQTLDYLLTRLPMFSRIGAAAIKPDLTNTRILCSRLGHPETKFRSIHVAGTNGKGSTSHMLAAILQSAGYKTGLYTSPHLKDFRERIKVNGIMIPEEFVVSFTDRMLPVIEEVDPSFFELTVAMAFDYFVLEQVDIAVIEVGLGGRLDSTNVIVPELSVITNIGYDHMNLLGNTLELIAAEKAGIIKEKVPVVIGEWNEITSHVFEKTALEKQAPIRFADNIFSTEVISRNTGQMLVRAHSSDSKQSSEYTLDMPGIYQLKNLATVLAAIDQLQQQGWRILETSIGKGLAAVKALTGLHGRWEQVAALPAIILDVAHNEDGMRQLVEQLAFENYDQLHIILGMVKDKEITKVLSLLPANASYYFTRAAIPRALPENELRIKALSAGLNGDAYPNIEEALKAAKRSAKADDLILVCGSVFLVGEFSLEA